MDKQNSSYRWVVFGAVLFTYFLIVSQRTAPGLITNQLMNEFEVTASTMGLLTSLQFLAYAGLQIPIGILSDRFGPNFFLIIGTLLNGMGTIFYSISASETVLFFARLLVGIGDATIWVNLVLILSQWFKVKEFVSLIGLAGMAGSFGFLLASIPFSIWIEEYGWRAPFFVVGILLCISGIFLYFILEKNSKRLFKSSNKGTAPNPIVSKRENTLTILRRIFTTRQAWATFLCHFGLVGTYVGFIGSWAVPYGMHVYGMTRSDASQLIMTGIIGAIIGAPVTSWISSRLESLKRPYVIVHLIIFVGWTVFLFYHGKPPYVILYLLFFITGYGNGASTLTFAIVREYFHTNEVGVATGFANTGGFLSAILLPMGFGKVLDLFHAASGTTGYFFGFIIPASFSLFGLIGGILIKEKLQERKQEKKVII